MNRDQAWQRLHRILRPEEQILGFCDALALPYEDPEMRLISGSTQVPVWVSLTPARLVEIGANDQLRSTLWGDIGNLEVVQQRKQWQYSIRHRTQDIPYTPIRIDPQFAALLQWVQSGGVPLTNLPRESSSYSPTGVGEFLHCDYCFEIVGESKIFSRSCKGCHRELIDSNS